MKLHILTIKEVECLLKKGIMYPDNKTGWLSFKTEDLTKVFGKTINFSGYYNTHIDFFKRYGGTIVNFPNLEDKSGGPFHGTIRFNFQYSDTKECWKDYLNDNVFKKIEI